MTCSLPMRLDEGHASRLSDARPFGSMFTGLSRVTNVCRMERGVVEVSLGREFILVVVGLEPFGHGVQLFDREKEELGIFEYGHRQRSAAGEVTDMGLHIAVRLGPRLDHGFLGECGSRYGLSLGAPDARVPCSGLGRPLRGHPPPGRARAKGEGEIAPGRAICLAIAAQQAQPFATGPLDREAGYERQDIQ